MPSTTQYTLEKEKIYQLLSGSQIESVPWLEIGIVLADELFCLVNFDDRADAFKVCTELAISFPRLFPSLVLSLWCQIEQFFFFEGFPARAIPICDEIEDLAAVSKDQSLRDFVSAYVDTKREILKQKAQGYFFESNNDRIYLTKKIAQYTCLFDERNDMSWISSVYRCIRDDPYGCQWNEFLSCKSELFDFKNLLDYFKQMARDNIRDAFRQALDQFHQEWESIIGAEAVRVELAKRASTVGDGAVDPSMAASALAKGAVAEITTADQRDYSTVSEVTSHSYLELAAADQDSCKPPVRSAETIANEIKAQVKAKWLKDGKGKMNAVAFIRKYYATWLDEPLFTRSHLTHDEGLASAYSWWVRSDRHPKDSLWPEIEAERKALKARLAAMTVEERLEHDRQKSRKRLANYWIAHGQQALNND